MPANTVPCPMVEIGKRCPKHSKSHRLDNPQLQKCRELAAKSQNQKAEKESAEKLLQERINSRPEAQIDNQIAATHYEFQKKLSYYHSWASKMYATAMGLRKSSAAPSFEDDESIENLIKRYRKKVLAKRPNQSGERTANSGEEYLRRIVEETRDAHDNYLNAEEKYTGWSRFYVVPGGHIHSSMQCSTCNKNGSPTKFGWMPQLSGLTEEDAVKEKGAILCTVCFPTAPVEWTLYKEGEQEKEDNTCPGSGTRDYSEKNKYNYMKCNHCNEWVPPRSQYNMSMRKHKKKK